jgi:hypothetical protein
VKRSFTRAVILERLLAGGVFVSEGVQKFVCPDALGVGRFIKIGIPAASVMAPLVGVVESVGGLLLIAGLLTRLAATRASSTCRHRDHEDSDLPEGRSLGDGPRGTHRLRDVARFDLPPPRMSWPALR